MTKVVAWVVYILRCADDSLYTGITNDICRRLQEHNHDQQLSSKYTWSRRPSIVIYTEKAINRSAAMRRELAIKKMSRKKKTQLILTATESKSCVRS